MSILLLESIILLVLIAITISIILGNSLLASVIIYCAFSFGAMLLYITVGAADVAFTEAVIGTVSTVCFIVAIKSVKRGKKDEEKY